MSRKSYVLLSCVAILAIAAIIGSSVGAQVYDQINQNGVRVWSPLGFKQKPNDLKEIPRGINQGANVSQDIPEDIVYGQVFRHIEELNRKADEEEQKGNNGNKLRNLYKDTARLDDRQARLLDKIAKDANHELKKLDKRAREIIDQVRSRTPNGKLEPGQLPPAPPTELYELSSHRKNVILQAVNALRSDLGEAEFARFSEFVNQKVKSGIKRRNGKQLE